MHPSWLHDIETTPGGHKRRINTTALLTIILVVGFILAMIWGTISLGPSKMFGINIGSLEPTTAHAAELPKAKLEFGFNRSMIFDWCRMAETSGWCDTNSYWVTNDHVIIQEADGSIINLEVKLWHLNGLLLQPKGTYEVTMLLTYENGEEYMAGLDPGYYYQISLPGIKRAEFTLRRL